jgi:hypothetical protein
MLNINNKINQCTMKLYRFHHQKDQIWWTYVVETDLIASPRLDVILTLSVKREYEVNVRCHMINVSKFNILL